MNLLFLKLLKNFEFQSGILEFYFFDLCELTLASCYLIYDIVDQIFCSQNDHVWGITGIVVISPCGFVFGFWDRTGFCVFLHSWNFFCS